MAKFKVIYADPPWRFEVFSRKTGLGRSADQYYPTMTLSDIKALDVRSVADKDSVLLLWVTMPLLEAGLEVGRSWGFKYKTCGFTWAKTNQHDMLLPINDNHNWFAGTGYWTRANTELCLLFTRGKPRRMRRDIRQLVIHPRMNHSAKPAHLHTRIEWLLPGPYLELFGRQRYDHWTVLGNEIDGLDIRDSLKTLADL